MKVMLLCSLPKRPMHALMWTGEVAWIAPPRAGDQVRVPGAGVDGDLLTVNSVVFESDGTIFLRIDPAGDGVAQRLRETYGWHTPGESPTGKDSAEERDTAGEGDDDAADEDATANGGQVPA